MVHANSLVGCLWLVIISKEVIYKAANCERTTSGNIGPVISLTRYRNAKSSAWITLEEENSEPDILIKEEDDYIINDTAKVSHILLTCHASYPVYWVMTDVKPIILDEIGTQSKGILDDEKESMNMQVKEFISYVEINNEVSFTGLYTCQSVEDDNLRKSTYVFVPGYDDQARTLVNADDEIEVGVNNKDSVIIPCKVSRKDAQISLFKKGEDENWAQLSLKKSFDPKRGFTVKKGEVESMLGKYKCSIGKEELIINVVEETIEDIEFPFKNDTDGIGTWRQRRSGDGVECCSNTTGSPELIVITCNNIPECDMKKLVFMQLLPTISAKTSGVKRTSGKSSRRQCTYTMSYGLVQPFLMQCVGNGVDFSGQYATEFKYPDTDKVSFVPTTPIQNLTYESYDVNLTIRIEVSKWENVSSTNAYQEFKLLDLRKEGLYVGDRFVIDCCGLTYHHAIGRIQRIVWKNGTVINLATPEKDRYDSATYPYVMDYCWFYRYDAEKEEYLITADENMSHVECIVPRWYDRTPGVLKLELNVTEPQEPVIIGSLEGVINVTYQQNQLGVLQLDCKVSQGLPPPHITWTKDGYELNQTDLYWSRVRENPDATHQGGMNVLFMRATKEIEGEFECTAENWKGIAQKTFVVKVNPRSYLDYWIALVIFGGFFAIISCCALRISTLEKQTVSKQVEPVPRSEEN